MLTGKTRITIATVMFSCFPWVRNDEQIAHRRYRGDSFSCLIYLWSCGIEFFFIRYIRGWIVYENIYFLYTNAI